MKPAATRAQAPAPAAPAAQSPAELPKGSTALATMDFGDDAGAGFEHHSREDYTIPFLQVLQGLSPQLETVEGAKPGKLINTVTNELFPGDTGVAFVPVETTHVFVEWKPRSAGGGFVGQHALNSDTVAKAKSESKEFGTFTVERVSEDGKERITNELIETFYVYGLLLDANGMPQPIVIAFAGTKIKVYRRWMTMAGALKIPRPGGGVQQVPLFAQRYRLKTEKQKNNFGEFFNFSMPAWDGPNAEACRLAPSDYVYQEAKKLRTQVQSGAVKATEAQPDAAAGGSKDEPF